MSLECLRPLRRLWLLSLLLVSATGSITGQANLGDEGPSYQGATNAPSGNKAESKLWYADGKWWGSLWSASAQVHMIHRLDTSTSTWIDTGTAIDSRPKSRADCLWDGAKLYVASHLFTSGAGAAGPPVLLFRYSYNPDSESYSLDTGFPVEVASGRMECLTITKDSQGTLWAAWMFDLRVWIAHSLDSDRHWSAPVVHPRSTTDTADDMCAIVPFQGNRVGVMWSDEVTDTFRFTFHVDGAADTAWSSTELALSGPFTANDQINLKSTLDGRVLALIKTRNDEVRLLVRSAGGTWSNHQVTTNADGWTRGILLVDETARRIHCFATRPILAGTIYTKTSSLDAISFQAGIGFPVIQRGDDPAHNDATSTKQSISGESGLVVLASHDTSRHYWFHTDDLGGPVPGAPNAEFFAADTTGFGPLTVQFLDASTGGPTSWAWSFGDGHVSSDQHPVHEFTAPGNYTVTLEASNGFGDDTRVRTNYVHVVTAPSNLVLESLEDAQVREGSPNQNYGALTTMRVRDDDTSDYHAYVKFEVPSTGNVVTSALLRLFVTDASPDGGDVHAVPSKWNEATINWSNAPAVTGEELGNLGNVALGTWAQLDVTEALTQDSGFVSFGIENADANSVFYSSREGADAPQLVLELDPPVLPVAVFQAERVGGTAPLTVQFFDMSSGVPTSWSWSFGDGGTSTVQNPSHVYTHPGQYTVSLQVSNENGSDSVVRTNYVRVTLHLTQKNRSALGGRDLALPLRNRGTVTRWIDAPLEKAAGDLVDLLESNGFDVRRMPFGGASYQASRRGETWSFSLQSYERGTVLQRAAR